MERLEQIMKHPVYRSQQSRIEQLEKERIFCRHGVEHALDVARIFYILTLEQGMSYQKDVVYGTAILHDIGRAVQYEENRAHHEAGAELANAILSECGYEDGEIAIMVEAIRLHHTRPQTDQKLGFADLLYQADKMSRPCFSCKAYKECYWEQEKRNLNVKY